MAYQAFTLFVALLVVEMMFSLVFRFRFRANRILPRFGSADVSFEYQVVVHNLTGRVQHGLWLFENFEEDCPGYHDFMAASEPGEKKRNRFDRALGYYRWLWLVSRRIQATAQAKPLPSLAPHTPAE